MSEKPTKKRRNYGGGLAVVIAATLAAGPGSDISMSDIKSLLPGSDRATVTGGSPEGGMPGLQGQIMHSLAAAVVGRERVAGSMRAIEDSRHIGRFGLGTSMVTADTKGKRRMAVRAFGQPTKPDGSGVHLEVSIVSEDLDLKPGGREFRGRINVDLENPTSRALRDDRLSPSEYRKIMSDPATRVVSISEKQQIGSADHPRTLFQEYQIEGDNVVGAIPDVESSRSSDPNWRLRWIIRSLNS